VEPLGGVPSFQLEPILKEDPADRTNSTTYQLESSQRQDGTEPNERSGLRSDAPSFELEEMTDDHPADTERTFDCVSIFISKEVYVRSSKVRLGHFNIS
jgi:hypothetical protein